MLDFPPRSPSPSPQDWPDRSGTDRQAKWRTTLGPARSPLDYLGSETNELCAARSIFVWGIVRGHCAVCLILFSGYVLRELCMGHCAVPLILFSGFVLYFAETPSPIRYVLYEPSLCYECACFHFYDFVFIDDIVALSWATWTL